MSVMRHARWRAPWFLYLVVGTAAAAGYRFVSSVELQTGVAIGITCAALAALVVGLRRHGPARRLPWYVLVAGQLASLGSWILWQLAILSDGAPPSTWAATDFFWIGNAAALLAAIVLLLRSREPGLAALVDSGIFACGLALLTWIFLLTPALEAGTGHAGPPQVVYCFLNVAMVAVLARLTLRRTLRSPAGALLLGSVGGILYSDVLYTWLTTGGSYTPGAWADLGWLLFPVLVGAAALHPSMATLYDGVAARRDGRLSTPYLILLTAASLSVPGLIAFDLAGGEGAHSPVVVVLATTLVLLVFGRLAGLIRQGERLRRDLAAQNRHLHERTAEIELLRELADATESSSSTDDALQRAVSALCAAFGWPAGHVYIRDRGFPQLAPTGIWHVDDEARWAPLVALTGNLHFVAGHGLPGLVLERREPVCVSTAIEDPTLPRSSLARDLGVRSCFAFPVLVQGEVAAVLEFFVTDELEADERLAALTVAAGRQLARVLERGRAEAALRASEERFRGLVANLPGAIYRIALDKEGNRSVHYVSDVITDIVGYDADDFVEGRVGAHDVIHPDDLEALEDVMREAIDSEREFALEYRMIHADGGVRWVSESGRVLQDDETGEKWLDGAVFDVTERKQAEQRLRDSERRTRMLFDTALDAVVSMDERGRITSWNAQAETIFGWTRDEAIGRQLADTIVPPQHREAHERGLARFLSTGETKVLGNRIEITALARDGREFPVELAIVPIEHEGRQEFSAFLRDISDRKDAEVRLREAEERYRILVEQLPMITYLDVPGESADDPWLPSYVSPQLETMLGWSREEWMNDSRFYFDRIVHPDDRDFVNEAHEAAFAGMSGHTIEHRLLHRDGSVRWFADHMVLARDDEGRVIGTQGYLLDITERKEAEHRLYAAETRFGALVESSDDAIIGISPHGLVNSWNAGAVRLHGFEADEIIGQPVVLLLAPEVREAAFQEWGELLVAGEVVRQREVVGLRKDGSRVPISLTVSPIRDERGRITGAASITRDITEQKRAAAELERLLEREREQVAELRTLDKLKDEFIALVSHELRTPLTSIRGYLELVTEAAGELTAEQQQFLSVVTRNAERLQSLVGDLLFVAQIEAGRLQLETSPLELSDVAAEAVESARPLADQKQIVLDLEAEPVRIDGDRGRLGQLLDNFLSNAIKFTPEGGTVHVRLNHLQDSAVLEIEDTGMGIPEDEQGRLFERFFRTTNATAQAIQGTGLGLTITKAIAEAHGGRITFTSVEGEGTTFRVELPLRATMAEAA